MLSEIHTALKHSIKEGQHHTSYAGLRCSLPMEMALLKIVDTFLNLQSEAVDLSLPCSELEATQEYRRSYPKKQTKPQILNHPSFDLKHVIS